MPKKVTYSDFDREVLARLPITAEQREELIKSMGPDSKVRVEVVPKPCIRPAPVVDV
jgi:hypothetical protein